MIAAVDISVATDIADAAMASSWRDYASGMIASEDRLTEALATRMRDNITPILLPSGNAFGVRALQSSAGRYGTSEETEYGADFVVTLAVATDQQRLCLGWIAQAKIRNKLRKSSWEELQRQCMAMERLSAGNGWAVLYGQRTRVIRASQIASLRNASDAAGLPARTWRTHFRRFFAGEFGDERGCRLLDSDFVRRRSAELSGRLLVLDLFYGDPDALPDWRGSHREGLVGLARQTHDAAVDEGP